ncbi:hypothetical protein [Actinophytocola sediminis]
MKPLLALTLGLVLVALGRHAWAAVGEIERSLAEADIELTHRD